MRSRTCERTAAIATRPPRRTCFRYAVHRRHQPDPRAASRRVGRPCAGARRGPGAGQHRARPARPGAPSADVCRASCEGGGRSEDDLAFLRDPQDFLNLSLVEQPNGDFGHTIVRQFLDRCLAARAVRAAAAVDASRASRSSPRRRSRKRAITSASAPAGSCVSATAREESHQRVQTGAGCAVALHSRDVRREPGGAGSCGARHRARSCVAGRGLVEPRRRSAEGSDAEEARGRRVSHGTASAVSTASI